MSGGMKKERSVRDNLVLATGKAPITLSALREARAAPGSGDKCRFKPTYCLWRVCAMRQAGGNDLRRETCWAVERDCHRQLKREFGSQKRRDEEGFAKSRLRAISS